MDYATVVQEIKNADPVEHDQGRIAPQYANHSKLKENQESVEVLLSPLKKCSRIDNSAASFSVTYFDTLDDCSLLLRQSLLSTSHLLSPEPCLLFALQSGR